MNSKTYLITEPVLRRCLAYIAQSRSLPQGWLVSDVYQLVQELQSLPPAEPQQATQEPQEGKRNE